MRTTWIKRIGWVLSAATLAAVLSGCAGSSRHGVASGDNVSSLGIGSDSE